MALCVHRQVIWRLAIHAFSNRYSATLGGLLWAFLQPMMTLAVFWFVFSYGLKIKSPAEGVPFVLVLFCGLVPWMSFNEALSGGANAILDHRYLVKKIAFPLEILPAVPFVTAAIVHIFMLVLLSAILMSYGIWPTALTLQVAYFFLAMCAFCISLSWILAALNVFHRDVGQALGVILMMWFWLTPIVWPLEVLPATARWIVELNPMVYVVEGYRQSLLYAEPAWHDWTGALYFWGVTAFLSLLGPIVFHRLKPHFADVL